MANFVPCPNVLQAAMIYTSANERVENVYHILGGAAWTAASITTMLEALAAWELSSAHSARSDNTILVEVTGRDLTTQAGAEAQIAANIVGSAAGGHLPNNCTIAIKASTGIAGRSFRGRTYWVGLTEGQIDTSGQTLTSAAQLALVNRMADYQTAVLAAGGTPVVLSRRHNNADRPTGVATPILIWTLTDGFVDSQRRRLPGHNRHR